MFSSMEIVLLVGIAVAILIAGIVLNKAASASEDTMAERQADAAADAGLATAPKAVKPVRPVRRSRR
jgi:hypothetical protein